MTSRPTFTPPGHCGPVTEADFDEVPLQVVRSGGFGAAGRPKCVVRIGDAWLVGSRLSRVTGKPEPVTGKRPDAIRFPSDESATRFAERLGQSFSVEAASQ